VTPSRTRDPVTHLQHRRCVLGKRCWGLVGSSPLLQKGTHGLYTLKQASITCGWCSLFTVQTRDCGLVPPPPPLLVTRVTSRRHPLDPPAICKQQQLPVVGNATRCLCILGGPACGLCTAHLHTTRQQQEKLAGAQTPPTPPHLGPHLAQQHRNSPNCTSTQRNMKSSYTCIHHAVSSSVTRVCTKAAVG